MKVSNVALFKMFVTAKARADLIAFALLLSCYECYLMDFVSCYYCDFKSRWGDL